LTQSRDLITIPVVVHVVYKNNEENISDEVIFSQIEALNEDFGMGNVEIDDVPTEFQDDIANVEILFCLAERDPEGNPTDGIVRQPTNQNQFTDQTDNIFYDNMGGSDSWDDSKYLNIWVGDLGTFLAGFATFPGDAPSGEDGVILNYTNFGRIGLDPPYHLGRTTSHEVGHFLGLNHPWGSGSASCSNDDGIADTPNTGTTYIGDCPSGSTATCGSNDMFMNFMYYTDDACMAMFSEGQKAVLLANLDGLRSGLKNSNGCQPVATINHELDNLVQIFPNPATNFLYLQLENTTSTISDLSIFDNKGQVVLKTGLEKEIDISALSNGVYYLKLTSDQGIVSRKILIQR